jgi:MFS transporter, DHA1 family, inner membrane transport protein
MGWAISMVFGGIAVSTAIGLPLGTFIGQELGRRVAFGSVAGLGVVALAAIIMLVPHVGNQGIGGLRAQAPHAVAPRVLAVLGVGFSSWAGSSPRSPT